MLAVLRRDTLISNPGSAGAPEEQLHFPFLFEAESGIWYMTHREGPHLEDRFGPGNRVQCVQSRDRGASWIPWMGLRPEPWLYQFFPSPVDEHTLQFCRTGIHLLRRSSNDALEATGTIFLSTDGGATWRRESCEVSGLPFAAGDHLVTLWGPVQKSADGALLWAVMSREESSIAGVVRSADGGRRWDYLSTISPVAGRGSPQKCESREPAICRTVGGDLICMVRAGLSVDCPLTQHRSRDDGVTWGEEPGPPLPGACPQLLLLPSGSLVCSRGTRRGMWALESPDGEGRSWSVPLQLYEGQTDGYSSAQVVGEDRFRVVYAQSSFDALQPGPNRIVRVELLVS